jgi:dTDP-4-dehydrorhamnose 3,5-epimerase
MKVIKTDIPEVLVLEPRVHQDARGYFLESYNRRTFKVATGLDVDFVQDNQSFSVAKVLRGLHYQVRQPQGKLVCALAGEIFDVAVDIRRSSATFGKWVGVTLTGGAHRMLWVPAGFAHGYLVLSDNASVFYKTTDFYAPQHERTILWNDPALGIHWPMAGEPLVNDKDRGAQRLHSAEVFE